MSNPPFGDPDVLTTTLAEIGLGLDVVFNKELPKSIRTIAGLP
jgi:hypothetical protein